VVVAALTVQALGVNRQPAAPTLPRIAAVQHVGVVQVAMQRPDFLRGGQQLTGDGSGKMQPGILLFPGKEAAKPIGEWQQRRQRPRTRTV